MNTSEFWYKAKHGPEIDLRRQTLSLSLSLSLSQMTEQKRNPKTWNLNHKLFFLRETCLISSLGPIIPVTKTSECWHKAKNGPEIELHRPVLSLSLSLSLSLNPQMQEPKKQP
jgi:hypothetical protein